MRSPVIAVYVLIALTALTGFMREAVIAAYFGSGQDTDAYFFAIGLVQTVHDLVFSGSLTASVIPLLRPMVVVPGNGSLEARARFVTTFTTLVLAAGVVLALLLAAGFPAAVDFLAPEMSGELKGKTVSWGRFLAWLLPANALLTLFSLILNAHDRFRAAIAIYLGANIVFIVIVIALGPFAGPGALPLAGLAGPLIFAPWLAFRLWRLGLIRRTKPDFSRKFFASALNLAGPSLLSLGIGGSVGLLMASHMLLRGFAAAYGNGGISAAGYAFRLYEAPVSIIVNPVAILVFPAAAAFMVSKNFEGFSKYCRQIITWGLIIMLPVSIVTCAGAEIVVSIILQRGSFDEDAMKLTAEALRGFAPAVLFESAFVVFFRVFYALRKPGIPVAVAVATLAFLAVLLRLAKDVSLFGMALSLSLAFALAAVLVLAALRQAIGSGALPDRREITKIAFITLTAGIPAMFFDIMAGGGFWPRLSSIAVFLVGYGAGLALLLPERRAEAVAAIATRLKRTRAKAET